MHLTEKKKPNVISNNKYKHTIKEKSILMSQKKKNSQQ